MEFDEFPIIELPTENIAVFIIATTGQAEPPQVKIQNHGSLKGKVTNFKLLYSTLHTYLHIVHFRLQKQSLESLPAL